MKNKHTEGPWIAYQNTSLGGVKVTSVCTAGNYVFLADFGGNAWLTDEEKLANARLAAAAPELLQHLIWALDAMAARNPVWTEGENYMAAREVIVQAQRGA
jgi:hypothetical protein